jgi:putative IMPACT (imprinted ancient) family translation regulator
VRAYAGAAESVLSAVDRVVQQPEMVVHARLGFADEQPVRHWCEQNSARIEWVDYGSGVAMALAVPEVALDEFRAFCDARGLDYQMDNEAT